MRRRPISVLLALVLVGLAFGGCELDNGTRSARSVADQVIAEADRVCVERGGTANIGWLETRVDDVVITCQDGTNHFFDG